MEEHYFVKSVEVQDNGVVTYDLALIRAELPEAYAFVDNTPERFFSDGTLRLVFKCIKRRGADAPLPEIRIGQRTRNNRY